MFLSVVRVGRCLVLCSLLDALSLPHSFSLTTCLSFSKKLAHICAVSLQHVSLFVLLLAYVCEPPPLLCVCVCVCVLYWCPFVTYFVCVYRPGDGVSCSRLQCLINS